MQWASRTDNSYPAHYNYNPTNDFDYSDPSNDNTNYFYSKPNHHHHHYYHQPHHHYDYHQPCDHNHRGTIDDYGSTEPETRPGTRDGNLEFHGFVEQPDLHHCADGHAV